MYCMSSFCDFNTYKNDFLSTDWLFKETTVLNISHIIYNNCVQSNTTDYLLEPVFFFIFLC